MSVIETIDQRSKGKEVKLYTFYIQSLSAVVFLGLSAFLLDSINFFFLFVMEAVGQIFLAIENKKGLDSEKFRVIYFTKSLLGSLAIGSFAIAVYFRARIGIEILPHLKTEILLATLISILVWVALYAFGPKRKDIISGFVISGSSLLLALAFLTTNSNDWIAYNLFAYCSVIMLGALFLKPWVAELINIFLWIHLFTLVIN